MTEQTPPATDDGVLHRLYRRNVVAATVVSGLVLAAITVAVIFLLPDRPGVFVLMLALIAGLGWIGGICARAAGGWSRAAQLPGGPPGDRGVVGTVRPLHPVRPGRPIKRRYPSSVVALRTETGPLAMGSGLVVHGRRDQQTLAEGDRVTVWPLSGGRPHRGSFVIRRDSDGAVFAAGSSPLSVL